MSDQGPGQGQGHLGDLLSGLLDGELAPSAETEARRHLASCHDCALELQAVQTARSWVRDLPAVDPPFGFYERLLREDRRTPAPSPVPWWLQNRRRAGIAAFTASAAAAAVLLGVASPGESPVSPPVNRLVEAHATAARDPLSGLAPVAVPVSFAR